MSQPSFSGRRPEDPDHWNRLASDLFGVNLGGGDEFELPDLDFGDAAPASAVEPEAVAEAIEPEVEIPHSGALGGRSATSEEVLREQAVPDDAETVPTPSEAPKDPFWDPLDDWNWDDSAPKASRSESADAESRSTSSPSDSRSGRDGGRDRGGRGPRRGRDGDRGRDAGGDRGPRRSGGDRPERGRRSEGSPFVGEDFGEVGPSTEAAPVVERGDAARAASEAGAPERGRDERRPGRDRRDRDGRGERGPRGERPARTETAPRNAGESNERRPRRAPPADVKPPSSNAEFDEFGSGVWDGGSPAPRGAGGQSARDDRDAGRSETGASRSSSGARPQPGLPARPPKPQPRRKPVDEFAGDLLDDEEPQAVGFDEPDDELAELVNRRSNPPGAARPQRDDDWSDRDEERADADVEPSEAGFSERVDDESGERRPRRRRRRGRSRDGELGGAPREGGRDDRPAEPRRPAEAPAARGAADDEEFGFDDERGNDRGSAAGDDVGEEERRPSRRRRRRGRPTDGAAETSDRPVSSRGEFSEERRPRPLPNDDQDQDEFDDEPVAEVRSAPPAWGEVPTWEEAISLILQRAGGRGDGGRGGEGRGGSGGRGGDDRGGRRPPRRSGPR